MTNPGRKKRKKNTVLRTVFRLFFFLLLLSMLAAYISNQVAISSKRAELQTLNEQIEQQQTKNGPLLFFTAPGIQPVFPCGRERRHSLRPMPHHSKCRCGEQEVHAAKQKAQTILFLQHRLCLVCQAGIARCCL